MTAKRIAGDIGTIVEYGDGHVRCVTPDEIGRDFVGADCTLDGQRAIICGRLNAFATVATLPNGPSYEYAWSTVARVMTEQDGAFKS